MRVFGHPVHVMLIHFPVAFWPAHALLHAVAGYLPPGVAAVAGFWLLAAGCALGWLAALAGGMDLIELSRGDDVRALNLALIHAGVNGSVLVGFSVLFALEAKGYPAIAHGIGFLAAEAVLLVLLFAGNYFGGAIVWGEKAVRQSPV